MILKECMSCIHIDSFMLFDFCRFEYSIRVRLMTCKDMLELSCGGKPTTAPLLPPPSKYKTAKKDPVGRESRT